MFGPAIRHSVFAVCTVKNFKHMLGMHLKDFHWKTTKAMVRLYKNKFFFSSSFPKSPN